MKTGDVSRPRRFADPARLRWYAYHRAVRFARRMHYGWTPNPTPSDTAPERAGRPFVLFSVASFRCGAAVLAGGGGPEE